MYDLLPVNEILRQINLWKFAIIPIVNYVFIKVPLLFKHFLNYNRGFIKNDLLSSKYLHLFRGEYILNNYAIYL